MGTEKRLIDANALMKANMYGNTAPATHRTYAEMLIQKAPTVDAVEVVHGEWSTIEDDYCGLIALQCSECNQEYWFEEPPMKIYKYCPNCGAKMDGGNDDGIRSEIQIKYINGEIKKEEFETQCKIENLRYISVLTERTLQMQTEIANQKRMSAMLDKVWGHE